MAEKPIHIALATLLLGIMAVLAGGALLRESITVDEVAHLGAGVSYLQKFDLRLNPEHPPLPKMLAALPLVMRGIHTDYSDASWSFSNGFFSAFLGEWPWGACGRVALERSLHHGGVGASADAAAYAAIGLFCFSLRVAIGWSVGRAALPRGVCVHAGISRVRSADFDGHSGDALRVAHHVGLCGAVALAFAPDTDSVWT
jgi:hypothetical protein